VKQQENSRSLFGAAKNYRGVKEAGEGKKKKRKEETLGRVGAKVGPYRGEREE